MKQHARRYLGCRYSLSGRRAKLYRIITPTTDGRAIHSYQVTLYEGDDLVGVHDYEYTQHAEAYQSMKDWTSPATRQVFEVVN